MAGASKTSKNNIKIWNSTYDFIVVSRGISVSQHTRLDYGDFLAVLLYYF